ncbi:unnamed protein product [Caretta caretta]
MVSWSLWEAQETWKAVPLWGCGGVRRSGQQQSLLSGVYGECGGLSLWGERDTQQCFYKEGCAQCPGVGKAVQVCREMKSVEFSVGGTRQGNVAGRNVMGWSDPINEVGPAPCGRTGVPICSLKRAGQHLGTRKNQREMDGATYLPGDTDRPSDLVNQNFLSESQEEGQPQRRGKRAWSGVLGLPKRGN